MEGREVVVHFANTRYKSVSNIEPTKTLHIGNMPYEMTDQDIQELFEDIPGMIDVRIPVDRRTGLPRGFAHVDFAEQADASHAKEVLSRRSPYERKLRVSFAKRKILTPDDYQRYQDKKLAKRTAARAQRQD